VNDLKTGNRLFPLHKRDLLRLQKRVPWLPTSNLSLGLLMLELGRNVATILERRIRPLELIYSELRVLTELFAQSDGTAFPTELSARTFQSPSNMSRISDALVSRGLVTREARSVRDRRKVVLCITEHGKDCLARLLPELNGAMSETFNELSEDERVLLVNQLKRLSAKLEGKHAVNHVLFDWG